MGRIQGDFTVMPMADLVIWLANRRLRGTLTLRREDGEKRFDVDDGMVVRAASNDPREYFGQFLLHFGLLTEDQLQRAFETQRETSVLLGKILVMIGIVPEEQVIQGLRVKIAETMLDGFKWKDGEFEFVDEIESRPEPHIEVAVPLVDLHAEGIKRDDVWSRFERVFPSTQYVAHVEESRVPATATTDTLDGRLIELCRAGLSVEEMTLELHATDFQIADAMLRLYDGQIVAPREPTTTFPRPSSSAPIVDLTNHPSRNTVPHLVREPSFDERRHLSAKQRYVLARIDGKRTVSAIIQVSPMHDSEALDIIEQFAADQIVRLA